MIFPNFIIKAQSTLYTERRIVNEPTHFLFTVKKIAFIFYLQSRFGQETAKRPFGLRVSLPPAHLSTTHGGSLTLSLSKCFSENAIYCNEIKWKTVRVFKQNARLHENKTIVDLRVIRFSFIQSSRCKSNGALGSIMHNIRKYCLHTCCDASQAKLSERLSSQWAKTLSETRFSFTFSNAGLQWLVYL